MSNDPGFELQSAMVAAAVADATLISLMGNPPRAYDDPPERAVFPYLVFDLPTEAEWDVTPTESDDGYGHELTIQWHVWSDYEGKKEISQILRALEELFRNWSTSLTDHRLINIRFQFKDRFMDADLQAWHGVIQFRAVTEET